MLPPAQVYGEMGAAHTSTHLDTSQARLFQLAHRGLIEYKAVTEQSPRASGDRQSPKHVMYIFSHVNKIFPTKITSFMCDKYSSNKQDYMITWPHIIYGIWRLTRMQRSAITQL